MGHLKYSRMPSVMERYLRIYCSKLPGAIDARSLSQRFYARLPKADADRVRPEDVLDLVISRAVKQGQNVHW